MWYPYGEITGMLRGRETSRKWFSFGGEFNGKEIRKIGFHDRDCCNNSPIWYVSSQSKCRRGQAKWKSRNQQHGSSRETNYSWWVEANHSSKRPSGERCPLPRAKSDRCSNGCQGGWTRTGRKESRSDGCGKPHRNNFGCPSSKCRKWRQGGSSLCDYRRK